MKKHYILALASLLSFGSYQFFKPQSKIMGTIAITQIAPHPSLDKIRQGIDDQLKKDAPDYKIIFQNAQGNMSLSVQIAQKFVHEEPDLIIPITTPSTLSIYKVAYPQKIPVVFSGVTDPKTVTLCNDDLIPSEGITGIRDFMDPQTQINFLSALFKDKKYRKIGVLYNIGESNAIAQVEGFEKSLKKSEFKLKKLAIHQSVEIAQAASKLAEDVDFILIFNDNLVVSAMPQLINIAKEKNIPVITTDPESVEMGALCAIAYDQYAMGEQTARLAVKVLKGTKPESLKIETAEKLSLYVNKSALSAFNLNVPVMENNINIIYVGGKT